MEQPSTHIEFQVKEIINLYRGLILDACEQESACSPGWSYLRSRLLKLLGERGLEGRILKIIGQRTN